MQWIYCYHHIILCQFQLSFGALQNLGHMDFYANGGSAQVCISANIDHHSYLDLDCDHHSYLDLDCDHHSYHQIDGSSQCSQSVVGPREETVLGNPF